MCLPAIAAGIGSIVTAVGGLTAAGAGAGAATLGGVLSTVGAVAGVAGALYQNQQTKKFAREQTAMIQAQGAAQAEAQARILAEQTTVLQEQGATERQITAVTDQQRRMSFTRAIAQQRAELAARGINLDSPTAILLGQTAATEMAFESQAVRSEGQARQREIEGGLRAARLDAEIGQTNIRAADSRAISDINARARSDRLKTGFGAVTSVLSSATDIWPGLADVRIGGKVLS